MSCMKNLYIHLHNSKPTTCPECGKETLHRYEDVYWCSNCGNDNLMGEEE